MTHVPSDKANAGKLPLARAKKKWSPPRIGGLPVVGAASKDKDCREKTNGRPQGGVLTRRYEPKIPCAEKDGPPPGGGLAR
jgi:hypothetical protein